MVVVRTSSNFFPEKKYVLDFISSRFLNCKFDLLVDESISGYEFNLSQDSHLSLPDLLWRGVEDGEILQSWNIPDSVRIISSSDIKNGIPSYFHEESGSLIKSGEDFSYDMDIIGSIFFVLSRAEEYLYFQKNDSIRFAAKDSLAGKAGILDRPVVEELLNLFKDLLVKCGSTIPFDLKDQYVVSPSHDIDHVEYHYHLKSFLGDMVLRRNPMLATRRLIKRIRNEHDSIKFIAHESKRAKAVSIFYFKSGLSLSRFDEHFDLKSSNVQKMFASIKKDFHHIGLHPAYGSFNDYDSLVKEKQILEEALGEKIFFSRQHYLNFRFPETLHILKEAGIEKDSTLGFHDSPGFRCGTTVEYKMYDIINRKALKLVQSPLLVMDATLVKERKEDPIAFLETFLRYKRICKTFKIPFTFLFHNTSFDDEYLKQAHSIYRKILTVEE